MTDMGVYPLCGGSASNWDYFAQSNFTDAVQLFKADVCKLWKIEIDVVNLNNRRSRAICGAKLLWPSENLTTTFYFYGPFAAEKIYICAAITRNQYHKYAAWWDNDGTGLAYGGEIASKFLWARPELGNLEKKSAEQEVKFT